MSRHPSGLALLVCLTLSLSLRAEPPRLDAHGDPLPASALARLGTVRFRHGSQPHFLMFSPDGKVLLAAEQTGAISLWDVATGKELRRLPGRCNGEQHVAFSADGKELTVLGDDQAPRVWDLAIGKELRKLTGLPEMLQRSVLAPDGKTLALIGQDQRVRLWDAAAGKDLHLLYTPPQQGGRPFNAHALIFSADGKTLAVAGGVENGFTVRLWETAAGKELRSLPGFQNGVQALFFSPGAKTLGVSDGNQTVSLWDLATGKQIRQMPGRAQAGANGNAFSPDGQLLLSAHEGRVLIEEAATGKEVRKVRACHRSVTAVAVSPDGKTLTTGGTDHVLRLWDLATGRELRPTPGHQGGVAEAACSPDGRLVASACGDGTIHVWEKATGREVRRLTRPMPQGGEDFPGLGARLAFARDGRTLAAGWSDGWLALWDVEAGKQLRQTRVAAAELPLNLTFSSDAKLAAAVGQEGLIRLIDVAAGKEIRQVRAFSAPDPQNGLGDAGSEGIALAFSPDGRSLLTTGHEIRWLAGHNQYPATVVRLVELATGKVRRQLEPQGALAGFQGDEGLEVGGLLLPAGGSFHAGTEDAVTAARFAPDGQLLALAGGGTVCLWDPIRGREVRRMGGSMAMTHTLAFSPDGKLLTTGSLDGTVRLWDVATGTALVRHPGHRGPVLGVAFAPDGKTLVTASADTTLLVWDVAQLRAADQERPREPARLEALWADLAADNAERAYEAVLALAAAPEKAVPLLRGRLRPVPAVEGRRLEKLIEDLDSQTFAVRRKATEELGRLGELAEPALEKTLKGKPTLEVRERVEMLLTKLRGPVTTPEQLRQLRAVEVLEKIGTPEARQLLQALAQGTPAARLTREAQESLDRLAQGAPKAEKAVWEKLEVRISLARKEVNFKALRDLLESLGRRHGLKIVVDREGFQKAGVKDVEARLIDLFRLERFTAGLHTG